MHKDNVAYLGVRGVGKMNKKDRMKVASWLRRQAKFIENNGDKTGQITTGLYRAGMRFVSVLLLCLLVSGCVTKYDDIVSDFHTIQVGPICTTVGHDQRKFNAETKEPDALTCRCDQLISVKRLVVKAGDSPEAWSCPAPVHEQMYQTSIVPSVQIYRARSLASTYVPAVGEMLGLGAVGAGLAKMQATRITQTAGSFSQPINTSTLLINGPVPPGVAR